MNIPLNTKLAVLCVAGFALAEAASASQTVLYQDSFSRSGNLLGTAPDVADTNGNLWQQEQFGQVYTTNGSGASNTGFFGEIYLPVNGSSGVTLDGTADFTLSVDVVGSSGPHMGIGLNTAIYAGGNQWAGSGSTGVFAALGVSGSGQTTAMANDGVTFVGNAFGLSNTASLVMAYNASAGTLTYTAGATTIGTLTGLTAGDIASLNYISLDNGSFASNAGTFDNFVLSVASVPEPSTYTLLGGAAALLVASRPRRLSLRRS